MESGAAGGPSVARTFPGRKSSSPAGAPGRSYFLRKKGSLSWASGKPTRFIRREGSGLRPSTATDLLFGLGFPFNTSLSESQALVLDIFLGSLTRLRGGGMGNGSPIPSRVSSAGMRTSACGRLGQASLSQCPGTLSAAPPYLPWESEPCWVPSLGPWGGQMDAEAGICGLEASLSSQPQSWEK